MPGPAPVRQRGVLFGGDPRDDGQCQDVSAVELAIALRARRVTREHDLAWVRSCQQDVAIPEMFFRNLQSCRPPHCRTGRAGFLSLRVSDVAYQKPP
jgi:hypothetical protein